MADVPLTELAAHLAQAGLLQDPLPQPLDAPRIAHVTGDSRQVRPGSCFVAVAGLRTDGHRFIPAALAQGAVALVGTASPARLREQGLDLPPGVPYLRVTDSRAALALLSAGLHGFPSRALTVIGVTGTDGKTTTSTILESILAAATRDEAGPAGAVGVITTLGARIRGQEQETGLHVTTPDAPQVQAFLAQMRDAGCRYAVVEATSHGLHQQRVAGVDFDLAVVTNITHEHLDYHGSQAAYIAAKALLFRALYRSPRKPGVPRCAVLNADDPTSYPALSQVLDEEAAAHPEMAAHVARRSYGLANPGDVTARDVVYAPDRTRFRLGWWGGEFPVETRLIGAFNVQNILAAATAALALGIDPAHIQAGVAALQGVRGRMERIDAGQPFLAVVDFAHSPASLERALETLRPMVGPGGRLIAVFGSAGLRDRAKRRLMGRVSGRLADFTVITAEDPRTEDLAEINREIAAGVLETAGPEDFVIVPDRGEAIWQAVKMARPGDVVAAFGKGHERSMCFGETEVPWSDQEAMRGALARRLGGKAAGRSGGSQGHETARPG